MVRQFDNDDLVSFVELVQCLAIRAIRMEKKISLQRIRAAMELARDKYDIEFPFARKHTTYLFEDDIVIRVRNENGEDHIVQITGKYKHHDLIKPVGEFYMEELSYDPDGLADSYTPLANGTRTIVLNPHVRFGHPTVQPCDISVDSLLNALASEGSIEAAADEYTVDREDVLFAVKYDDILSGVAS